MAGCKTDFLCALISDMIRITRVTRMTITLAEINGMTEIDWDNWYD